MFGSKKPILIAFLICLSTSLTVTAQSDRGTITGIVTDSSGDNLVLPTAATDALLDTLVRDDHHGHLQNMSTAEKVKTRLSTYLSPFAPHPSVEALGT